MPDPTAQLYLGETFGGRYLVTEFLSAGGFCFVFKALDITNGTDVALKVLKPGATGDAILEFETEGYLLEKLKARSHVVNLVGPRENKDQINISKPGTNAAFPLPVNYMILELAEGCLVELVVNRATLSWKSRLDLFRDVVLGVHQMHLSSIVHRDIKSENALIRLDGNAARACVADLGRGRDLTAPTRFVADQYVAGRGDLRFAPPEMLHLTGIDDPVVFRRADLYLIGSTLFELCTGQGITSVVYGDPRAVMVGAMASNPSTRASNFASRYAEHRARYEPAFRLAEQEMPAPLRFDTGRLLRQLCDPEPARREKRYRAELGEPPWGLNWVLRRIDVLRRLEKLSGAADRRRVWKAA